MTRACRRDTLSGTSALATPASALSSSTIEPMVRYLPSRRRANRQKLQRIEFRAKFKSTMVRTAQAGGVWRGMRGESGRRAGVRRACALGWRWRAVRRPDRAARGSVRRGMLSPRRTC